MRSLQTPSKPSRPLLRSRRLQVTLCRNRILFEPHEVRPPQLVHGQSLTLCDQDARAVHLREVVRIQPGDTVRVGVVGGLRANARTRTDPQDQSSLELTITSTHPPLPPPKVDLLLALPRPKALKRLWPVLAEIGVGTVVLCGAERVEKSFWTSKVLEPSKVYEGLVKGLEQCGDTQFPTIILSRTLRGGMAMLSRPPAFRAPQAHHVQHGPGGHHQPVEGALAGMSRPADSGQRPLPWGVSFLCTGSAALDEQDVGCLKDASAAGSNEHMDYAARALLHPRADSPALLHHVLGCLQAHAGSRRGSTVSEGAGAGNGDVAAHGVSVSGRDARGKVLLAIGPEGGWRAGELELLMSEEGGGGFTQVSLGDRILSSTCALVSAVGTVQSAQQLMEAQPNARCGP